KGQAKNVRQAHRVLQGKGLTNNEGRAGGLLNLRRILEVATFGPTWEGAADGEAAWLMERYEASAEVICHTLGSVVNLFSGKSVALKKEESQLTAGMRPPRRKDYPVKDLPNLPLFEGVP
ncbi:MAG: hypothetical protein LC775_08570, partial [Acidobacteria bacterium]|nr:hypothetical protein [Acidobacteriota bacterium]